MKPIADVLEISRSHLVTALHTDSSSEPRTTPALSFSDKNLLEDLRVIVGARPSYGYRRACAILNKKYEELAGNRVNHKRIYRVMKHAGLLLPKHFGLKPERKHEGKVVTMQSNTRWCSDSFQIRCWDSLKIEVAFLMDTCDREVFSFVAKIGNLIAGDIQNMLVLGCEKRFPGTLVAPKTLEWLTDNGKIFTALETQKIARDMKLEPCHTPAYSPESNGMSEAFVKRFKQDYVYVNEEMSAEEVIKKIPKWIQDYNENHPHKGLKMLSPSEFRKKFLCN